MLHAGGLKKIGISKHDWGRAAQAGGRRSRRLGPGGVLPKGAAQEAGLTATGQPKFLPEEAAAQTGKALTAIA